jgi:hypothetical protein
MFWFVDVGCFMRFMTALTHGCPIAWPKGFPGLNVSLTVVDGDGDVPTPVVGS